MTRRDAYLAAWREIELCPSLGREHLNPVTEYVQDLEVRLDLSLAGRIVARAEVERLTAQAVDWQEVAKNENERRKLADCRVTKLETALRGLLDGLDDHWVTLPEGMAALEAARAALRERRFGGRSAAALEEA